MQLVNHTPFPAMTFEARDRDDRPWHVLVVRATMTLDGGPPRLAQNQRPLVLGDTHVGEAATSSTLDESDLAPYKPGTDVLVRGTARPSDGVAARAWEAEVTVGARRSRVRVTGPRAWVRDADDRWRLTEPEPCDAVPMRYELAYGGSPRTDDRAERCEENPVGVGFAPRWWRDGRDRFEAPRIESFDDPVTAVDRAVTPQGFGPHGRAWLPRRARAGTFDAAWLRDRWPVMPPDFDDRFWNAAPPALVADPYLRGDELVTLTGVRAEGEVSFRLPGHYLFVIVRYHNGVVLPIPLRLDALTVDVDAAEVGVVYRHRVLQSQGVRAMEACMDFRKATEATSAHG